jgi:hypothetical protein
LEKWFELFEKRNAHNGFSFGYACSSIAKKLLGRSYAEAEEFALSVYRHFVLQLPYGNSKDITQKQLSLVSDIINEAQAESLNGGSI